MIKVVFVHLLLTVWIKFFMVKALELTYCVIQLTDQVFIDFNVTQYVGDMSLECSRI